MGRVALIFFCLGIGSYVVGSVLRSLHWPLAGVCRLVAFAGMGASCIFFIIAIARNKGFNGLVTRPRKNDESGR